MGVSVSKAENSGSETPTVPGQVYTSVKPEPGTQTDPYPDDSSNALFPRPLGQENETLQLLCGEDADDLDSAEWNTVYQRLKTDCETDLHVANTRFSRRHTDDKQADKDRETGNSEQIRTKTSFLSVPKTSEMSNDRRDRFERSSSVNSHMPVSNTRERSNHNNGIQKIHVHESSDATKADIDDILKATEGRPDENERKRRGISPCLLVVPAHAPSPMQYPTKSNTAHAGADPDPFEGIAIPRSRVDSFGSVNSLKINSNEVYKMYFEEIRSDIGSYGYFDKFPTPSVLKEAQRAYRRLHRAVPMDSDGKILPHPPQMTKKEVFSSFTTAFDIIDNRIMHAPVTLTHGSDPADIVLYLCEGLDDGDELSKVRAISTWLAIRQIKLAMTKRPRTDSAEFWCQLFRSMCRQCRIKCQLIKGVIRGSTYLPGDDLDKHRGVWVAVLVNKDWWVVDPVLKHDHLDVTNTGLQETRAGSLFQYAESFFQDPESFIFTHFPDTEHWQLLARPVTSEELKELPVLRSGFFDFNLKIFNLPTLVQTVSTEMKFINVSFPETTSREFLYRFYYYGNDALESEIFVSRSKKVSLQRFVFMETKLDMNSVNFQVRFPRKGPYILNISALSESRHPRACCTFKFVYEHLKSSSPLPVTGREEWGPGYETLKIGLTPTSHKSGEIIMEKGVLQIVFTDKKGLQFKQELLHENSRADPTSARVNFLRDKNGDVVFIVDIDNTVSGTFVLLLYARSDTSKPFVNFCNYLIRKLIHKLPVDNEEIEKKTITPKYHFLPKQTSSDDEKAPLRAPDNGTLQLNVKVTNMSQIKVELKFRDGQEINFSEHARSWIENDEAFVDLNFPRKGKYSVRVIGRGEHDNHAKTLLSDDIVVSVPSEKWSPFPKLECSWDSYFKIEAPLTHHIEEKSEIPYSVHIVGAHDVAVLAPGGWYHLEHVDNDLWKGQVWSGPRDTRCKLLARFQAGSDKFSELLLFKVTSEDTIGSLKERQERMRNIALNYKKDDRIKT